MENLETFEDFTFMSEMSEKFTSLDFLEILMEMEHELGYDELLDEGWSFGTRGPKGDNTFKFVPGKNDNGNTSTEIFTDDKRLKYHEVLLPKSGVMSYNLYKISDMRISKALKHPQRFIDMYNKNIDFDSIDKFMKRTAMYIRKLLNGKDIDIITYPQSSSSFNKEMVEYILRGYKDSPGIKVIPNLVTKNIRNVYINYYAARSVGLTNQEIHQLQMDIDRWIQDVDIYELSQQVDELNDEILLLTSLKKRGRPSKEMLDKRELVKVLKQKLEATEKEIKLKRKGRRGKDKTIGDDGRAKNFEIKSIADKQRRSIEGLFEINPNLKGIQQYLKGKNIILFDDNISSGATLDDICLELGKYGVKSILPITLAIIPKTVYGEKHETLKNKEGGATGEVKAGKPKQIKVKDIEEVIKEDDKKENGSNNLTILWLDDERNPNEYLKKESDSKAFKRTSEYYKSEIFDKYENVKFVWVKNFDEFKEYIEENGLPKFISFDRDLKKGNGIEKGNKYPDGEDCAKWLKEYCEKHNKQLPNYFVHSANPNGRKNIPEILKM